MKTLKKSLCLILALVFVLGLCTFGAGAAFTDDADIEYGDAVAVMQGLGILKGYEDGSFQPAKTVTRAEAATMITKMILGEAAAAKLPKASVFDDVADSHWASKYINFCAGKKIIVGRGNGIFDPEANVTGLELAKMLLVACGYGNMGEFAPDCWDVNTFTYGVSLGIFGESDADYGTAATREECALYVFNTLNDVDLVAYDVDYNDYVNKGITFGEKVYKLDELAGMVVANQASGADYTVVEYQYWNEETDAYATAKINFAFETGADMIGHKIDVYFNTNGKRDADRNEYFNTYLENDLSTVYTISVMAPEALGALAKRMNYPETSFTDVKYFADGVKAGSLYDAMSIASGGPATITYFTGSVYSLDKDTVVASQSGGTTYAVKVANGSSDNASTYLPVDELIVDEDGEIISAVKNSYSYAKVTGIDEDEGVVEFKWCDYAGSFSFRFGEALIANCYEGIAEDDIVLVEKCGTVYTLTATTTMTAKVTQTGKFIFFPMFNNSIIAESTAKVFWNDAFLDDDDGSYAFPALDGSYDMFVGSFGFPYVEIGNTYKFYLGKNGAAFAAVKIEEAVSDYVFVTNVYTSESKSYGDTIKKIMAQGVNDEGNEVNLLVGYYKDATTKFGIQETASGYYDANAKYTFASTSDPALFKTVEVSDQATGMTYVKLYHAPSGVGDVYQIDSDIKGITDVNTYKGTESHIKNQPHYLTGATKYIYVTGSGDTLKITEGSALRGASGTTNAYYVAKPTGTTAACDLSTVWVYGTSAAVSTGSFIFATDKTTKSGIIRVNEANKEQYGVYIDGVRTTIALANTSILGDDLQANMYGGYDPIKELDGFYSYTVDSDGLYTLDHVSGSYAEKKNIEVNYVSGSLVMVDDPAIADDINVADFDLIDLTTYGYQDAKNVNHKITDADSLAEAVELDYKVKLAFVYDTNSKIPVGTLYVTSCKK